MAATTIMRSEARTPTAVGPDIAPEAWLVRNALLEHGVRKGDRVCLYLPMMPELAYTMLACARIGAVHSIVFTHFINGVQTIECTHWLNLRRVRRFGWRSSYCRDRFHADDGRPVRWSRRPRLIMHGVWASQQRCVWPG